VDRIGVDARDGNAAGAGAWPGRAAGSDEGSGFGVSGTGAGCAMPRAAQSRVANIIGESSFAAAGTGRGIRGV